MLAREALSPEDLWSLPHPYMFPPTISSKDKCMLDPVSGVLLKDDRRLACDARGGLLCDEPGLGKTITMLALILRTKEQEAQAAHAESRRDLSQATYALRAASSRKRDMAVANLVPSSATLMVVPDALLTHWTYQIKTYIVPGKLRVYVDSRTAANRMEPLPTADKLAEYDVVLTSLQRLTHQWQTARPASALESRAPKRYGFEGTDRYIDGKARGQVSSLLRVHWARVVVDEGHKLGGRHPSHQVEMARCFVADKRWVISGTPTPDTLQGDDLRHLRGLLVFLRDLPYGEAGEKAWLSAIVRPFEQNQLVGLLRLQDLLGRLMIRHTKESVDRMIPVPIRRTVFIDPTPFKVSAYNTAIASIQANLVATNMDPKYPGMLHRDSLLSRGEKKKPNRTLLEDAYRKKRTKASARQRRKSCSTCGWRAVAAGTTRCGSRKRRLPRPARSSPSWACPRTDRTKWRRFWNAQRGFNCRRRAVRASGASSCSCSCRAATSAVHSASQRTLRRRPPSQAARSAPSRTTAKRSSCSSLALIPLGPTRKRARRTTTILLCPAH